MWRALCLAVCVVLIPTPATSITHCGTYKLTAYTKYHRKAVTASGVVPSVGRTVAVDPKIIPLGSIVYIDGIGVRVAEDTGGRVKGKHIDVYLGTKAEAKQFGVQYAAVAQ